MKNENFYLSPRYEMDKNVCKRMLYISKDSELRCERASANATFATEHSHYMRGRTVPFHLF